METTGDFFALGPSQDRVRQDQESLRIKLSRGERIYVGGYGLIKVVDGFLSVLGARIGVHDDPLPFYSPKSSSLLYFSPCIETDSVEFLVSELENGPICLEEGDPSLKSMFMFPSSMATCVPNFFIINAAEADCVPFDLPADWLGVADALKHAASTQAPVAFICGPRKVGKSSMTRFIANSLWSNMRQVAFIDLDPGQTEFTPPGCLSLKLLSSPLFGPPLAHQCITEGLVFLGTVSPADDPNAYINGAKMLASKYLTKFLPSGIPLVVNTMGWVTGMGMSFLQSLLQLLPTTHVIAFPQKDTEPFEYVQEALFEKTPFSQGFALNNAPQVAYVQPAESSGTASSRLQRISPIELRSFTFSAYFLGIYRQGRMCYASENLTFRSMTPLKVPIASIRIVSSDKKCKIPNGLNLLAINLALVGLAHVTGLPTIIDCVGLGLVRSVNVKEGYFYVITPVPVEVLRTQQINCFVIGRIHLPATFMTSAANANGPFISYQSASSGIGAGGVVRKARTNIVRKYGQA